MKALQSPNAMHSRSQLLFISKGMRRWLKEVSDIGVAACRVPHTPVQRVSLAEETAQTAVRLLTDMALHTWKEAG